MRTLLTIAAAAVIVLSGVSRVSAQVAPSSFYAIDAEQGPYNLTYADNGLGCNNPDKDQTYEPSPKTLTNANGDVGNAEVQETIANSNCFQNSGYITAGFGGGGTNFCSWHIANQTPPIQLYSWEQNTNEADCSTGWRHLYSVSGLYVSERLRR